MYCITICVDLHVHLIARHYLEIHQLLVEEMSGRLLSSLDLFFCGEVFVGL